MATTSDEYDKIPDFLLRAVPKWNTRGTGRLQVRTAEDIAVYGYHLNRVFVDSIDIFGPSGPWPG